MPVRPAARTLTSVLAAGVPLLLVGACGSAGGTTTPTTGSEPTATVTATATQTATQTATATSTETATATPSTGGTGGTGTGGTGLCAAAALRVRYADDRGGAGAGNETGTLTFTNTGSAGCTLRGFPGVSYVTGDDGSQVGQAASRTDDAVTTRTLAAGRSATATLRRSQPGNYGDDCQQTAVRGFRVYPPGSKEAVFVAFKTTGCKSTAAPLLQVGPVR